MKVTKFGHCCLLIEENGLRVLTDPGVYSEAQNEVTGINVVLITHEHQDHFHLDSMREIIKNNPEV
ncbi:MAG TPA: MBL fold metallo-hydrolase, partial [Candidatus Paceibacterota bacterium]|nr:MBL fold metallo-hydrolase [Candidatus Paceibacterota bacterium]